MNRRELFAAAGAAALITAAGAAHAAGEHDHDHSGHGAPASATPNAKLLAAAGECGRAGQVCLSHCLNLIAAGDTSVAACAKTVNQMLAMCNALGRLAAADSPHLAAFAKVCQAVCADCEKECRKHETHHAECKACAESCAACVEECKKIAA